CGSRCVAKSERHGFQTSSTHGRFLGSHSDGPLKSARSSGRNRPSSSSAPGGRYGRFCQLRLINKYLTERAVENLRASAGTAGRKARFRRRSKEVHELTTKSGTHAHELGEYRDAGSPHSRGPGEACEVRGNRRWAGLGA